MFGNEIAYFDARSKGLFQTNNSKHFPIDQYLHDRVTPATLSTKPLAYCKPIHPSEMPRISTCPDTITDDSNVPTKDDKYPWLHPDDKRRHMTDAEIIRLKLNLGDWCCVFHVICNSFQVPSSNLWIQNTMSYIDDVFFKTYLLELLDSS